MAQLDVHHIEWQYTNGSPQNIYSARETVTHYKKFPLEINLKQFGTYTRICPICGGTLEITVYPKLPLLKGFILRLNLTIKNREFFLLFPLPLFALFHEQLEILLKYLPDILQNFFYLCLISLGILFIGILWKILHPGFTKCHISGKYNILHQIYYKGNDLSSYSDSDMDAYGELKIYYTGRSK